MRDRAGWIRYGHKRSLLNMLHRAAIMRMPKQGKHAVYARAGRAQYTHSLADQTQRSVEDGVPGNFAKRECSIESRSLNQRLPRSWICA